MLFLTISVTSVSSLEQRKIFPMSQRSYHHVTLQKMNRFDLFHTGKPLLIYLIHIKEAVLKRNRWCKIKETSTVLTCREKDAMGVWAWQRTTHWGKAVQWIPGCSITNTATVDMHHLAASLFPSWAWNKLSSEDPHRPTFYIVRWSPKGQWISKRLESIYSALGGKTFLIHSMSSTKEDRYQGNITFLTRKIMSHHFQADQSLYAIV